MIDWTAAVQWLGPKLVERAKAFLAEKKRVTIEQSRNEHAAAAANEIIRMVLLGEAIQWHYLANLIAEFRALESRGARVPRDLQSTVYELIARAEEARERELMAEYQRRSSSRGGVGVGSARRSVAKKAAQTPTKKMASGNNAVKKPAAKQAAAKKAPAKKAPAKKVAARKAPAKRNVRG